MPRSCLFQPPRSRRAALLLVLLCACTNVHADVLRVLVARTANESGLISRLAEAYESDHPGHRVQLIGTGSLDVLERGRAGGADAVISHTPQAEQLFMADGYGLSRTLIMYNQFAIFGPPGDPLSLSRQTDLLTALRTIAEAEPPFLVQGYRSGTQYRLLQLWAAANIRPDWLGYESTDSGSVATLGSAAVFGAYAFADLASYFSLPAERRAQLVPLVRDHRALRNDYHYLVIDPDKVPGAQRALAEDFLAFLVSDRGQRIIGQFGSDRTPAALYTPAAHLDQELQVRRAQAQLGDQRRQMYLLSAAVALALALSLFAGLTYRRARDLSQLTVRHAQRLERAAADSDEGLFEWDLVSGSLFCTPRVAELLQLDKVDARNLHALLRQALNNAQSNRISAELQTYLNEPDSGMFRCEMDLHGKPLELRARASRDAAGTPMRVAGSLRSRHAAENGRAGPGLDGLHDPVTGLPARQLLIDRLQHTLQQCNRDHSTCLVMVLGINGVRTAGALSEGAPDDTIVKAVAARLRQLLRASDTLARLDDDNFVIVLATTDEHHGRLATEKLLAGLQRPFHVKHQSVHVDAVLGCASYPEHGEQHHTLLHRAQLAMLQATRDGQPMAAYHSTPRGADAGGQRA